MTSPFERVILKLCGPGGMGFCQFLFPFMLSSAIFYGLLRKSKIMGENAEVVNATIALVASFLIWAYPIIIGIDITQALTSFFMQGLVLILFVGIGIMLGGMFHPDIQLLFKEKYPWFNLILIIAFLGAGFFVVISSGLWEVFGHGISISKETQEMILAILTLGGMMALMAALVYSTSKKPAGEEKK